MSGGVSTRRDTRRGENEDEEEDKGYDTSMGDNTMGERPHPTVHQMVLERMGRTSDKLKNTDEIYDLVKVMSAMLAAGPMGASYSGAVLSEAGNVMLALMDEKSRAFSLELLLPWARRICFLEPDVSKQAAHTRHHCEDLQRAGFCLCYPGDVLPRLFDYTLEQSQYGVPDIISTFWFTLALAAPPYMNKEDAPPNNVPPLSAWVAKQAQLERRSERDKQTCLSLSMYIKGLAVKKRDEKEEIAAKEAYTQAVEKHRKRSMNLAKLGKAPPPPPPPQTFKDVTEGAPPIGKRQMKAMELMATSAKQRREKSTRKGIEEEEAKKEKERLRMLQSQGPAGRRAAARWAVAGAAARALARGESMAGVVLEARAGGAAKIKEGEPRVGHRRVPLPVDIPDLRLGEQGRPGRMARRSHE